MGARRGAPQAAPAFAGPRNAGRRFRMPAGRAARRIGLENLDSRAPCPSAPSDPYRLQGAQACLPNRSLRPPRPLRSALLLLAVLGGTLLRLWPTLAPGSTQFIGDSAAMSRLVLTYADTGKQPAADRLSEAPGGRALGAAYAPGLIVLAGTFERVMRSLGSRDANLNLSPFGRLCGGLAAVPAVLLG